MPSRLNRMAVNAAVIFLAVVAATLCAAIVHYGGLHEVLRLPAALDPSTPAFQDGYRLIAISRGRTDGSDVTLPSGEKMYLGAAQTTGDTILWVRPPQLPPGKILLPSETNEASESSFFDVQAQSSSGDEAKLPWYYEGGCLPDMNDPCSQRSTSYVSPDIVALQLPGGYPGDIQYFDISISDRDGHKATWRIKKLPHMRLVPLAGTSSTFSKGGATVSLAAYRYKHSSSRESDWPGVDFNLSFQPLSSSSHYRWEFTPSPNYPPSLSWEPTRLPWLTGPDSTAEFNVDDSWLLSRKVVKTGVTSSLFSPWVRSNDHAIYHGVLSQFLTRADSVDFRDVQIQVVEATEAGMKEDTYCISEQHKQVARSNGGLTIILPKQHRSFKWLMWMVPNSLNLLWRLSPISPGSSSGTAGMLPDSPLCQIFHRPVTIWFEAFADGKPIGYLVGVLTQPGNGNPVLVHFPTSTALPKLIHDLKITIHQRVDIQRIPVTLSTRIVDE